MDERRLDLANIAFEDYLFGDDVDVEGADGWDTSDPSDLTRIVYISSRVDPDSASDRVSFHVRFNPDGDVVDVYGLLMSNGCEIGSRGLGPACAETLLALFGGAWGEHHQFTLCDWSLEAGVGSTRLGYWEWVAQRVAAAIAEDGRSEGVKQGLRRELADRFPELLDDSELNGGDAVERLSEWFYELGITSHGVPA